MALSLSICKHCNNFREILDPTTGELIRYCEENHVQVREKDSCDYYHGPHYHLWTVLTDGKVVGYFYEDDTFVWPGYTHDFVPPVFTSPEEAAQWYADYGKLVQRELMDDDHEEWRF